MSPNMPLSTQVTTSAATYDDCLLHQYALLVSFNVLHGGGNMWACTKDDSNTWPHLPHIQFRKKAARRRRLQGAVPRGGRGRGVTWLVRVQQSATCVTSCSLHTCVWHHSIHTPYNGLHWLLLEYTCGTCPLPALVVYIRRANPCGFAHPSVFLRQCMWLHVMWMWSVEGMWNNTAFIEWIYMRPRTEAFLFKSKSQHTS